MVLTIVLIGLVAAYFTQSSRFGIKYRPASNNVKQLVDMMQQHIDNSQVELVSFVNMMIIGYQNMPAGADTSSACVVQDSVIQNPLISPATKAFMKKLKTALVKMTCVNGKLDKTLVIKLLTEFRDSLNL